MTKDEFAELIKNHLGWPDEGCGSAAIKYCKLELKDKNQLIMITLKALKETE